MHNIILLYTYSLLIIDDDENDDDDDIDYIEEHSVDGVVWF